MRLSQAFGAEKDLQLLLQDAANLARVPLITSYFFAESSKKKGQHIAILFIIYLGSDDILHEKLDDDLLS